MLGPMQSKLVRLNIFKITVIKSVFVLIVDNPTEFTGALKPFKYD